MNKVLKILLRKWKEPNMFCQPGFNFFTWALRKDTNNYNYLGQKELLSLLGQGQLNKQYDIE